jgi:hypothetical protein
MSRKTSSSAPSASYRPGHLDRVAGVAQLAEVHALHDAAGVDVEAGHDTDGDAHAGTTPRRYLQSAGASRRRAGARQGDGGRAEHHQRHGDGVVPSSRQRRGERADGELHGAEQAAAVPAASPWRDSASAGALGITSPTDAQHRPEPDSSGTSPRRRASASSATAASVPTPSR